MSKGTRLYAVRLPVPLVQTVELTIARRNLHSTEEGWTLSEFIRLALERECKKMERSRRPRKSTRSEGPSLKIVSGATVSPLQNENANS